MTKSKETKKALSKYEQIKKSGYDIDWDYDKDLITISIFKDYGIPATEQGDMHIRDYHFAIAGLSPESQLASIIRARKGKKNESDWEIRERHKWLHHLQDEREIYLNSITEEERKEFFKKEIAERKARFH